MTTQLSRHFKCGSFAHRDLGVVRHRCTEKSLIWHFAVNNTFAAPGGTKRSGVLLEPVYISVPPQEYFNVNT